MPEPSTAATSVQRFDDIPRILAVDLRLDKPVRAGRYDGGVTPPMAQPSPPRASGPYDRELAAACRLAREAGKLQMDLYGRLREVRTKGSRKGSHDLVTEADHASEALILGGLRALFPGDGQLAEESGAHRADGGAGAAPDQGVGRVWVVDPLDGTINYAHGLPLFCVSIGLVVDGQAVVGAVFDPARGDLYDAVLGGGTRRNGQPVQRPLRDGLAQCLATIVLPQRGWRARERAVVRATRVNRVLGSSALALAYVADGRFDVFVQAGGLSAWDVAAAGLIAAESGAMVTDLAGGPWLDMARPTGKVGVVAAAAPQHAELLRLLTA
jgi:myo-inositol-1(or 4)-monophosphatase